MKKNNTTAAELSNIVLTENGNLENATAKTATAKTKKAAASKNATAKIDEPKAEPKPKAARTAKPKADAPAEIVPPVTESGIITSAAAAPAPTNTRSNRNMGHHGVTTLQSELAWEIKTEQIQTASGIILPGYKAITRNDNGGILNVAKDTYTPTPNARTIEVVERLAEITGFQKVGFDEFKDGKMILGYLQADKNTKLLGWDMEEYMVIGNSHDGSTGFFIGTTSVMLRCMNQFSRISQNLKAYHTKNNDIKIEQLLSYFESYQKEQAAVERQMKQFSKIKIDEKIIVALTEKLFRMESGQEEVSTRKANLIEKFRGAVDTELKDLGKNAFGLLNGVTRYTTHVMETDKVFGNVLGQAAKMNRRTVEFITDLATA